MNVRHGYGAINQRPDELWPNPRRSQYSLPNGQITGYFQLGERQTENYQATPLCGTPKAISAISDGRGKCGK